MTINYSDRGILEIDNAQLIYRNFEGVGSKYNREGDRNFAVRIPNEELAKELTSDRWNVKTKRDADDDELYYLPVKVKFNGSSTAVYPEVYLVSGGNKIQIDETTVGRLDRIRIADCNLDIRPYDWEVNGKTGRSAYLHGMEIVQDVSRFASYDNE